MALDPLATAADLAARNITVADGEESLAAVLLAEASAAVREAAGCPISEVTSTVDLPGVDGLSIDLPGGPVSRIESVQLASVEVIGWQRVAGGVYWARGWRGPSGSYVPVRITWVHGLPQVPEDVKGLVCDLVGVALAASRGDDAVGLPPPGQTSERMGNWQASYEGSDKRPQQRIVIGEATRRQLRRRFGGGGVASLQASR